MPGEKSRKKETATKRQLPRVWQITLLALLGVALCAGAVALTIGAGKLLFSGNDRFTLRKVEVVSDGYWHNRGPALARALQLAPGRDNIYGLDLKDLRSRAGQLPSVERCKLQRILPDTLRFVIIERIPRARLQGSSEFLVDSSGVLLPKNECMNYSPTLPLLAGYREKQLVPGLVLTSAKPALELIMQTLRNYPDMEIVAASVGKEGKLVFYLRYRQQRLIKVTMPDDPVRIQSNLNALRSAILQAISEGNRSNICDLSFDGMVVWSGANNGNSR